MFNAHSSFPIFSLQPSPPLPYTCKVIGDSKKWGKTIEVGGHTLLPSPSPPHWRPIHCLAPLTPPSTAVPNQRHQHPGRGEQLAR